MYSPAPEVAMKRRTPWQPSTSDPKRTWLCSKRTWFNNQCGNPRSKCKFEWVNHQWWIYRWYLLVISACVVENGSFGSMCHLKTILIQCDLPADISYSQMPGYWLLIPTSIHRFIQWICFLSQGPPSFRDTCFTCQNSMFFVDAPCSLSRPQICVVSVLIPNIFLKDLLALNIILYQYTIK